MRILFLNLPNAFPISRASRWPEKTKSGTLYYPYWLCYAAGVCMERGHAVNLIDCITRGMSTEETVQLVRQERSDYLMCEITTPTCGYDYRTIAAIKAAVPAITVIVGGTHATVLARQVLTECAAIDIVAMQEYDETLDDIMRHRETLADVNGIAYRENGEIVVNPARPWLKDMDSLPFVSKVYQRFLDVNDYFYAFAQQPMMQIFSARGCPYRCNFCSYPQSMSGHPYRFRSVPNFVDELSYISSKMPEIREIFIEDDTFTVDPKRVSAICDEILRRGLTITWSCNARADLTYDVMAKMKQAGCRLLVVGYESGSQQVLDETRKGIKLADSLAFAQNAKKLKLKVFGCFMIGLKGDTLETIEQTYRFAKKVCPDMVFFQQAVPFPGTAFYHWAKESGYLRTEDYTQWLSPDGYLNCLVDYPYADHIQIEKLRDRLMGRYYFSLTFIFRTFLANLTWIEFQRVTKAGWTYVWFRIRKIIHHKNNDRSNG